MDTPPGLGNHGADGTRKGLCVEGRSALIEKALNWFVLALEIAALAALVAVTRRSVVFEPQTDYLQHALAFTALLLAIGISWRLLTKSDVCDVREAG